MKRLVFVTAVTILTITAAGGCRLGSWWQRGAVCETYAPACTETCAPGCDPLSMPGASMGMGAFPSTMESLPATTAPGT